MRRALMRTAPVIAAAPSAIASRHALARPSFHASHSPFRRQHRALPSSAFVSRSRAYHAPKQMFKKTKRFSLLCQARAILQKAGKDMQDKTPIQLEMSRFRRSAAAMYSRCRNRRARRPRSGSLLRRADAPATRQKIYHAVATPFFFSFS